MMHYGYILAIFVVFSQLNTVVHAQDFTHFKLNSSLKQKTFQNKTGLRSIRSQKMFVTKDKKSPNLSPLLEEISQMLSGKYDDIGLEQTQRLIKNHDLGGGVLNFSGFTWYKPMLNYNITAHREVAPELFSEKWIVNDKFIIFIEAATLLSNFKKDGLIDISEKTIGAFAGLTFSRTYHYYHFANSYLEGLTSDFSKLFGTINKFNSAGAMNIEGYEVLKKIDEFSANAGGIISAPTGNGTTLQAGAFVQTAYKNTVTLQGVGTEDSPNNDEFLRLSIDKHFNINTRSHLSLQYDFFNLLKLTILSADLEYEYAEANKTYLSFSEQDKDLIKENPLFGREFSRLVNGNGEVHNWKNNVISMEERIKENLNSKFSFLLFGSMKKRATEQIKIIKDGVEKIFFKNYSESIKYVQGFFSRLFSKVIQKIFDFNTTIKNKAEQKKQMVIEYEQESDLNPLTIKSEEKFSIRLRYSFFVDKTHKWYHRSYYKSAINQSHNFTNLSDNIKNKIKSKELRGPLTINSVVEINYEGLSYFNQLNLDSILTSILNVCKIKKEHHKKFYSYKTRRRLLRGKISTNLRCGKKLVNRYQNYIEHLQHFGEIDLMKFKKFFGYYFSKLNSLNSISNLFGPDSMFLHGSLNAKTKDNRMFQTFFKAGQFKGLGVIDSFKRGYLITPINHSRHD